MATVNAHVFIVGQVQGVGFRYYIREEAEALGVAGWVKNLPDGRVEAVFDGEKEKVGEMIRWCRRGTPAAVVEDVKVAWGPHFAKATEGKDKKFEIRR